MVRLIILVVVLVLALSYFGISIRDIAESPAGQDNIAYVWSHIENGFSILRAYIEGLFTKGNQ